MMYNFEELNEETRKWMLKEFKVEEQSENPYSSPRLSALGKQEFPKLMEKAIQGGNEVILTNALSKPEYWVQSESYRRSGITRQRRVNFRSAAKQLAITEFNTWYVRGLARRLIEEEEEFCQVYRAESAWEPRRECLQHETKKYRVKEIYNGHRARYWPPPGNINVLSIPVGPNCHHTIRRISNKKESG